MSLSPKINKIPQKRGICGPSLLKMNIKKLLKFKLV